MSFTGRAAGPTPRNARSAMPRCMSQIAPGNLRSSSKARAFSARTSFGAEDSVHVLTESVPAVALSSLGIPVSNPLVAAYRLTPRLGLDPDPSLVPLCYVRYKGRSILATRPPLAPGTCERLALG